MAILTYKALDSRDRFVSGEIDAASREAAAAKLSSQGLQVLAIEATQETRRFRLEPSFSGVRVSDREVTGMLRDLGMLLRSGLVLDEALLLLADGATRPVARLLSLLRRRILEGTALSDAL